MPDTSTPKRKQSVTPKKPKLTAHNTLPTCEMNQHKLCNALTASAFHMKIKTYFETGTNNDIVDGVELQFKRIYNDTDNHSFVLIHFNYAYKYSFKQQLFKELDLKAFQPIANSQRLLKEVCVISDRDN